MYDSRKVLNIRCNLEEGVRELRYIPMTQCVMFLAGMSDIVLISFTRSYAGHFALALNLACMATIGILFMRQSHKSIQKALFEKNLACGQLIILEGELTAQQNERGSAKLQSQVHMRIAK